MPLSYKLYKFAYLSHFGVNVVTGVSEFCDLLG